MFSATPEYNELVSILNEYKTTDTRQTRIIYLTGRGGTGKSENTLHALNEVYGSTHEVLCLTPTNVAKNNLLDKGFENVQTIHSTLGVGRASHIENLLLSIQYKYKSKARYIKRTENILAPYKAIFIDECFMVGPHIMHFLMDSIEATGRTDIILIFAGDPHQLPSIKPMAFGNLGISNSKKNYRQYMNMGIHSTSFYYFKHFLMKPSDKVISFQKNFRCTNEKFNLGIKQLEQGITQHTWSLFEKEISIFDDFDKLPNHIKNYTKMAYFNDTVSTHNQSRLDTFKDVYIQFKQKDGTFASSSKIDIDKRAVNSALGDGRIKIIINDCPLKTDLKIKKNVPIIMNYSDKENPKRYINGQRGIFLDYNSEIDQCLIDFGNEQIWVEKITVEPDQCDIDDGFEIAFTQFPFDIAFSVSIHKMQSLGKNNLILEPDFLHDYCPNGNQNYMDSEKKLSALYTAMGRIKDPKTLFISKHNTDFIKAFLNSVHVNPNRFDLLNVWDDDEMIA